MDGDGLYNLKLVFIFCIFMAAGCRSDAPRMRLGCLPSPTPGSRFLDPDNLGDHSYSLNFFEKDGIVYTAKAGHIDVTHLRWTADYTRYLAQMTRSSLLDDADGFSFIFVPESSKHHVTFELPENWGDLSKQEKQEIAAKVSPTVGAYLAFNAATWHEIITWMKLSIGGLEFNSAFSWEDNYSNLLGTKLAVEAIRYEDYDQAMTQAIDSKLKQLGVQPKRRAVLASEKMRDKWFTGYIVAKIIRKNFDIGLDDSLVQPVVIPDFCDAKPLPLAVPDLSMLKQYGISMKYQIEPTEWGKNRLLKVVYPDSKETLIEPAKHYSIILKCIKDQALERYGCKFE